MTPARTLKESLGAWTDRDLAAYELALALGIMTPADDFATDVKHVFWSANAVGDGLDAALEAFVAAGFLEWSEERDRIRWNPMFKSRW